jgi:hypothetical protein
VLGLQVLETRRSVLGEEHPDTMASILSIPRFRRCVSFYTASAQLLHQLTAGLVIECVWCHRVLPTRYRAQLILTTRNCHGRPSTSVTGLPPVPYVDLPGFFGTSAMTVVDALVYAFGVVGLLYVLASISQAAGPKVCIPVSRAAHSFTIEDFCDVAGSHPSDWTIRTVDIILGRDQVLVLQPRDGFGGL